MCSKLILATILILILKTSSMMCSSIFFKPHNFHSLTKRIQSDNNNERKTPNLGYLPIFAALNYNDNAISKSQLITTTENPIISSTNVHVQEPILAKSEKSITPIPATNTEMNAINTTNEIITFQPNITKFLSAMLNFIASTNATDRSATKSTIVSTLPPTSKSKELNIMPKINSKLYTTKFNNVTASTNPLRTLTAVEISSFTMKSIISTFATSTESENSMTGDSAILASSIIAILNLKPSTSSTVSNSTSIITSSTTPTTASATTKRPHYFTTFPPLESNDVPADLIISPVKATTIDPEIDTTEETTSAPTTTERPLNLNLSTTAPTAAVTAMPKATSACNSTTPVPIQSPFTFSKL